MSNLNKARTSKQDEFYTRYEDIAAEVEHYKHHFKGKVVGCNCDDPRWSNFPKFFKDHFDELGLRGVVSMFHGEDAYLEAYDSKQGARQTRLDGDGDFRDWETQKWLQQVDIIVTNPPFSLFRDFMAQLMELNKKFLILGSANAVTYKEIFPLIQKNKIWIGVNVGAKAFQVPLSYEGNSYAVGMDRYAKLGNVYWYTNLDMPKRHKEIPLVNAYNEQDYPFYDNYNIINVDKTKDIPYGFDDVMGVPISFLERYCPEQFQILGIANNVRWIGHECITHIKGRKVYNRILVRRRT